MVLCPHKLRLAHTLADFGFTAAALAYAVELRALVGRVGSKGAPPGAGAGAGAGQAGAGWSFAAPVPEWALRPSFRPWSPDS